MRTLSQDARERFHIVYESDRYIVEEDARVLSDYKVKRVYSVTDKGTYVRHTFISKVDGRAYGYDWALTLVDPAKLKGAQHVKRSKPHRLDLGGRD